MLSIIPIPAFNDNYIWCIIHPEQAKCVVIDPGDANPVLDYLESQHLKLEAILITHNHWDHVGGITELLNHYPTDVYGSLKDFHGDITHSLEDNDKVIINSMSLQLQAIAIPGHTAGHIGYYGHNMLFSGDTLFTGGCGRVFEGTMEQMFHSLQKLVALPDETLIYCAHEYTYKNLKFARGIEPDNEDLLKRIAITREQIQNHQPTVPASLKLEKQTNPFLRCHVSTVKQTAETHAEKSLNSPFEVFSVLRRWRNDW